MFNPFVTACHLRDAMRNGKIYFAFTERKRETDSYIFRVCTERKKKLVMKGLIASETSQSASKSVNHSSVNNVQDVE
jgi:hypothetical protein